MAITPVIIQISKGICATEKLTFSYEPTIKKLSIKPVIPPNINPINLMKIFIFHFTKLSHLRLHYCICFQLLKWLARKRPKHYPNLSRLLRQARRSTKTVKEFAFSDTSFHRCIQHSIITQAWLWFLIVSERGNSENTVWQPTKWGWRLSSEYYWSTRRSRANLWEIAR